MLERDVGAVAGEDLLQLALSRPGQAVEDAGTILARTSDDVQLSYALQALSVAHREQGATGTAIRYARRALRAAQRSRDGNRAADVAATLGATLAVAGRTREALDTLDAALPQTSGALAAKVRVRRGGVLHRLGRDAEALEDLRAAFPALRAAGDIAYEARALNIRAMVYDNLGQGARSDRDLARSEELLLRAGQQLESVWARHNRGHLAFRTGDFPSALRHYDAAERMYTELGEPEAELELDRCRLLLAAGLPDDAVAHAQEAVRILEATDVGEFARADALLTAASAGLAAGDAQTAIADAVSAARLFRSQQRDRWYQRARRTEIQARWQAGERTRSLLRAATEVATNLDALRDPDTADARLLAGRIALAVGDVDTARRQLAAGGLARGHGAAISRATGWLARAMDAEAAGDSRAALAACRRGLDLLDQHRLTLGATEMRARATVRGAELAAIATRQAAAASDAVRLLQWSERWRATALTAAPVRPPDDAALATDLAALRGITRTIAEATAAGTPTAALEHEQARLETSVRRRMMRTSGTAAGSVDRLDVGRLRQALGDTTLVELVEVDEVLHAVVLRGGRTTMHTVGPTERALSELEYALFGLRRIAVATAPALVRAALLSLRTAADSLEKALLGPAAARLGDGPVLVVPSGRLHSVPWSLVRSLRDREVTVAPSATSWLRACAITAPRHDRVALVVGPGLETGGAEVEKVTGFYPDARLLTEQAATADRVLTALDGASLAHVAAHGTFRADNALFSALQMADGPLTVHDLERLRRPPHRLVLSSCNSGLGAVAGADELLGLSSALIGLGSAGLLSSVVPVNDEATVALMVAVHEQLGSGASLAQALHRARRRLGDDDAVLAATGQSFIALGAA